MIPGITYIGVDDIDLKFFENQYPTPKGISYNSYLIKGDKIAVTDTVDARCTEQWVNRLDEELAGREPDYLMIHHMEPDHSANVAMMMEKYPALQLVASAKAIAMIPQFFGKVNWIDRTIAVKDGDTLDLGAGMVLSFMTAPMIHWPEVVVTYLESRKALFTADAFGRFGSLQYEDEDWTPEARRYYVNIVGKYGSQVQTLLRKLRHIEVEHILPLHGPVLNGDLSGYIRLYDCWSSYRPETKGVLIAYASIYGGTAACAERLGDILRRRGDAGEVVLFDLCRGDMSEAISQAFRLSSMVLASVTYDGGIFPAMSDFISHLSIKTYRNRRVGFIENGSWAPVAARVMAKKMDTMTGIEPIEPIVSIKSRMRSDTVSVLEALAASIVSE